MKQIVLILFLLCSAFAYSQNSYLNLECLESNYILNNDIDVQLGFDLNEQEKELTWHPGEADLYHAIQIINQSIESGMTKSRTDLFDFTDIEIPREQLDALKLIIENADHVKIQRTTNKIYEHILQFYFFYSGLQTGSITVYVDNEWIVIK